MTRTLIVVILTGLVVSLLAGCASSRDDESSEMGETVESGEKSFYEGENIEWIVATKPGGGYDTYGGC